MRDLRPPDLDFVSECLGCILVLHQYFNHVYDNGASTESGCDVGPCPTCWNTCWNTASSSIVCLCAKGMCVTPPKSYPDIGQSVIALPLDAERQTWKLT